MTPSRQQLSLLCARQRHLSEKENTRLARKIHDEVSQQLTVLSFELALLHGLKAKKKKSPVLPAAKLQELTLLVQKIQQTVREISDELRPKILDELGLTAALQWHSRRLEKLAGIRCQLFQPDAEIVLPPSLSNELFCVVVEIIEHILRPANIVQLEIHLRPTSNSLRVELRIKDKKLTRRQTDPTSSVEWISVFERTSRLHARLRVSPLARRGTTIEIAVPTGNGKNGSVKA